MLPSCFHKVLAMSAYEVAYEQNGRKASHSISLTASIASDAVVERPVSLCNGTLYSFDNLLKCEGTVP
uniref:AlNc14C137G7141 protein n=1 Tax=Albugo laibachii Nc14 TaxID=890382 RepID=F0WKV2_9STRA|nr:AlNc14C137G7141 [Albugo laibachii Nc14]|eukprot:CCA21909.1 AlNc14C137G7141 [Albugo laibachii Nc14]